MSPAEREAACAGRIPDFLLIGAMKAGSTTLWGHLARHPSIFMCLPKEPQFWSREAVLARGLDWYCGLFAQAREDQLCGEASTCYSRWPHFGDVAGRIAQHLPRARLVYLLRHPVERSFSHYRHLMDERILRGSGPVLPFEAALEEIPEILDASRYAMQIERFLVHYRREALHVLTLDDLRARPEVAWQALQEFLGVAVRPLDRDRADSVDNRAGDRLVRETAKRTVDRLLQPSLVGRAARLLPDAVRRRARQRLERSRLVQEFQRLRLARQRARISSLSPATRALVLERLAEPTRDLEAFLGRALPAWFR